MNIPICKIVQLVFLSLLISLFSACNDGGEISTDENTKSKMGAFPDVSKELGLIFQHEPGVDTTYFMPEYVGPGSAFLDYDNDGDLDIYLINSGFYNTKYASTKIVTNQLFRQEENGQFTNVTLESGLADDGFGMGVAVADIDNDGDLDVYITNFEGDKLYRNMGDGTFQDVTRKSGINNQLWSTSAAFLDFDLDGYLDLYVVNYVDYDHSLRCTDYSGRQDYCGPESFHGVPDAIYHNNGDGTFTDISKGSGIAQFRKKGLGVVTSDVNNDGYPDLYVANDGEDNLLWINQKNGTFRNDAAILGAAVNVNGHPEASMGIAIGDVNDDLTTDFFITHLAGESNTLYTNEGALGYMDNSASAGFDHVKLLPYTGFGTGFLDYNKDGLLDLVIVNGKVRRTEKLVEGDPYWKPYCEPNQIFLGAGKGKFRDVSDEFPEFSQYVETSRGMALGDYDNDGDLDILVNNCGAPARLHRNDAERVGNWISIEVFDPAVNRAPIGTKITLQIGNQQKKHEINPGYSYLSSNDYRCFVGLGEATAIDQILVEWPGNQMETFSDIAINQQIKLVKGSGTGK